MLGAYAGDNMFRTANQPTPLNTEYVLCDAPVGLYIKSVTEITLL